MPQAPVVEMVPELLMLPTLETFWTTMPVATLSEMVPELMMLPPVLPVPN